MFLYGWCCVALQRITCFEIFCMFFHNLAFSTYFLSIDPLTLVILKPSLYLYSFPVISIYSCTSIAATLHQSWFFFFFVVDTCSPMRMMVVCGALDSSRWVLVIGLWFWCVGNMDHCIGICWLWHCGVAVFLNGRERKLYWNGFLSLYWLQ